MPETFIIAPDGTIAWKHVGPLTEAIVANEMADVIDELSGR
jgi:cytochrome c biogenesis protein CcmG/thiol:disulfide interchange protein DsbE